MAASLEQAEQDNRRLMDSMVSLQETERKDIARELHDEYGPSLFAIRADLGAISRWVRKKEPRYEEMQERLLSISNLVMQIQRINSRLLERLRPLVLEQMSLPEAIQRLVQDWRDRYPDLTIAVAISPIPTLSEAAVHALYRAAQECLTNIVRHAHARHASITLTGERDRVRLLVQDDGRGLPADQPHGFGLLGMAERARAAGGGMSVESGRDGGTKVTVWVGAESA
jgi:two-component system sensor histidine kinase UhpB